MISLLVMIVLVILTFLFADSVLTPLLLLLSKKIWLLVLKIQALATKKNLIQALVQSLLLAAKALLRLINKTITVWILPLLMTRRQRYWLHHALIDVRVTLKRRALRGWVRWRRQPFWLRMATLGPLILVAIVFFIGSGILLAGLFGVTFIIPWIGGLPFVLIMFFRRALARLGLFILERLGVGTVVNKAVDRVIDLVWWKTPEPVQRRFDAWWRRMKMRLRRRVIGPRRQVTKHVERYRLGKQEHGIDPAKEAGTKRAVIESSAVTPSGDITASAKPEAETDQSASGSEKPSAGSQSS